MSAGKVDWLEVERQIRSALRDYNKGYISAGTALTRIDTVIGDETKRGYELPMKEIPSL